MGPAPADQATAADHGRAVVAAGGHWPESPCDRPELLTLNGRPVPRSVKRSAPGALLSACDGKYLAALPSNRSGPRNSLVPVSPRFLRPGQNCRGITLP